MSWRRTSDTAFSSRLKAGFLRPSDPQKRIAPGGKRQTDPAVSFQRGQPFMPSKPTAEMPENRIIGILLQVRERDDEGQTRPSVEDANNTSFVQLRHKARRRKIDGNAESREHCRANRQKIPAQRTACCNRRACLAFFFRQSATGKLRPTRRRIVWSAKSRG